MARPLSSSLSLSLSLSPVPLLRLEHSVREQTAWRRHLNMPFLCLPMLASPHSPRCILCEVPPLLTARTHGRVVAHPPPPFFPCLPFGVVSRSATVDRCHSVGYRLKWFWGENRGGRDNDGSGVADGYYFLSIICLFIYPASLFH